MSEFLLLILSLSISGTVIAGLIFAIKAIWKKKLSKSVLYYLWLIALVRLVLPFSFEGALLNRIYEGDLKATASAFASYEPVSAVASQQTTFSIPAESESTPVQITETVSSPEVVSVNAPAVASVRTPVMAEPNKTPVRAFNFEALAIWIWLLGFAVFCAFTLTSYGVFAVKLKKVNRTADDSVLGIVKQLGCKVKIYQNPLAKTPMLIGIFKPTIILPDVQYTEDELRGVIVHELIHKRRHDLLYKWFVLFVNAAHWFNPVVWLVRREVNRACELSCDEAVIMNLQADQKQTYGETLINLAAAHRYPAGVIATTLCEEKRTLKERLGAIMNYQKKGLWNKVLSCVLIMAIAASGTLLGACGEIATSLPSELFGKDFGYPEALNIIAPNFFWNWNTNDENAETAKKLWQDEMSERYGVDITVFSNSYAEDGTQVRTATEKRNNVSRGKETFSGLIQMESILSLQDIVNSDSAVPLDDYLADNAVWNALPDELKSTFKVNGHIYAVPANVEDYMYSRIFYKDALEKTGIDVTDLKSLKEFAAAYAKATGNYAFGIYGNSDIADILNAFGLYDGEGPKNPIGYDPTEDCFVDFLTKGAAVDALEYLRELYTAGGLDCDLKNYSKISQDFADHKTATCSASYGYYNLDDYSEVLTLNPEHPQVLFNQVFGFFMTKDTVQPKETINFFVNMMFGSEQNYLDCWLGSSDGYTLNSDGTITVEMVQNSDGSSIVPAMPNLTGGFSGIFPHSDADLLYSQDGVVTKNSKIEAGKKNKTCEGLNDALEKGIVVKVPPAYSMINCPAFYSNIWDIYDLYETCIQDAITATDWTVQQIVDEYKEAMLNMGGNAMLDEMNAAIGKKSAYYYG